MTVIMDYIFITNFKNTIFCETIQPWGNNSLCAWEASGMSFSCRFCAWGKIGYLMFYILFVYGVEIYLMFQLKFCAGVTNFFISENAHKWLKISVWLKIQKLLEMR